MSTHAIARVPARLPNGIEIQVEVRSTYERGTAAMEGLPDSLNLNLLRDSVSGIAQLIDSGIAKVRPQKVMVEFSLELAYEDGHFSTILLNGESRGSLKIALEWTPKL